MHPFLRRLELNLLPVFDAVLRHGSVRLAPEDEHYAGFRETDWFEDDDVVLSNLNRAYLTFEDYLAARHLVVTPWNEKRGD